MLFMRSKFAIIIVFVIVIFISIVPLRAKAQDTLLESPNSNDTLTFDGLAEQIDYQAEIPAPIAITLNDVTVQRGPTTAN